VSHVANILHISLLPSRLSSVLGVLNIFSSISITASISEFSISLIRNSAIINRFLFLELLANLPLLQPFLSILVLVDVDFLFIYYFYIAYVLISITFLSLYHFCV